MKKLERWELPGMVDTEGNPVEPGAVYLLLGDPDVHTPGDARAASAGFPLEPFATYRTVHAISKYQGGEIRGYVATPADAPVKLFVRYPATPADWPELDAAVCAVLGVGGVS